MYTGALPTRSVRVVNVGTRGAFTATHPSSVTSSSAATTRTRVTSAGRSPTWTRSSAHFHFLPEVSPFFGGVPTPLESTSWVFTTFTPAGVWVPNSNETLVALPGGAATAV